MNIHKREELKKERDAWMKNNIFLVEKHYKRLKRKGIISEEQYLQKLEKFIDPF